MGFMSTAALSKFKLKLVIDNPNSSSMFDEISLYEVNFFDEASNVFFRR